ncbi:class I SAM-dependent methyltransferase [Actinomadura opuntiae]|uniref:class I SAM-dependent methyltransferase n=1 Tax=Actinomadura sp. OS1-43 TaxID=604315 RepID=UPI00255AFE3B|nr:class I SAM-dependent methyltransferase [Actinomadura sp. OS1-43]MDL4820256.1 class I SAM-dependent methyltransferase [Actinomadura sp. OS1-43]
MQEIVRRADRCRVCGRDDWLDVVSFGETPLAGDFLPPDAPPGAERRAPLEVAVCRGCRLMSLRHVVDPEALFGHYRYVSSESDLIMNHMRRLVADAGLDAGDLVVEFGSNTGVHLELFRRAGMRVVGVDPARNLAEIANGRGVETVAEPFTATVGARVAARHGRAAMVLGRQCFAHIHDVHEVLDGVNAVLDPAGVLAVEVPYLVELLASDEFDTIFHEHLSYFSLGTLRTLFGMHGLRVVDVRTAPVHGGSIVVYAAPRASARDERPAVARMLAREDELGLSGDGPYLEFARRTETARAEIGDLVRSLAAEGRTVAGYGAPAKGSTLLNACGLTSEHVRFCTDTTALKQGRLMPGSRVPIVAPEEGLARRPDYFLLLAWNYADEIIGRERAYLEAGGRFIVPVPRPRVVSAPSAVAAP